MFVVTSHSFDVCCDVTVLMFVVTSCRTKMNTAKVKIDRWKALMADIKVKEANGEDVSALQKYFHFYVTFNASTYEKEPFER